MAEVCAYIDGLNLYHGARELMAASGSTEGWKWLDVMKLTQRVCPHDEVISVKYFTAHLSSPDHDPDLAQRQQIYIRALEVQPTTTVILGEFVRRRKRMPLVRNPGRLAQPLLSLTRIGARRHNDGQTSVPVWRAEEKGTDVNLGVHLLMDAFKGNHEKAVVFSNDADLREPIRMLTQDLGRHVTVVNPRGHSRPSASLQEVSSETRRLRAAAITSCQLPQEVRDSHGVFYKPSTW